MITSTHILGLHKTMLVVLVVLCIVPLILQMPYIDHARDQYLDELYLQNLKECGCDCVIGHLPFVFRFNFWFITLFLFTPVAIFAMHQNMRLFVRIPLLFSFVLIFGLFCLYLCAIMI